MLVRPSLMPEVRHLGSLQGSVLVYSLWEGYLTEERGRQFIEWLEGEGVVIHHAHTSGHANLKALVEVVARLEPGMVVPVHTKAADKYARWFTNVRIVGDGECVELKP
jgi:ribonuclease J